MACVVKIFWKRTYLLVEYLGEEMPNICLKKENIKVPFEMKQLEGNLYRGKLNVCIAEGRSMLSAGTWTLEIDKKDYADFNDEVLLNVEALSNVFRYDNDKAYIVTFFLEEIGREQISLKLQVDYMMKNPHPESRRDALAPKKKMFNLWYRFWRKIKPKTGKNILFLIENREEVTGNMEALYNRMMERELHKTHNITVSSRNIFKRKSNLLEWLLVVYRIAKNDFIFVEDYVPVLGFLDLDEKTVVVQVWHAGFGFKSVGYGRFGLEGSPNPFESCHRKYTYGIIGNDHLRDIYSEVWGIEKENLLATGMPRLSNFLDEDRIQEKSQMIYEKLPVLEGKQVITFAPTYRGSNQKDAYYDMERVDQKALYDFCEKTNSVVLMKFHPFLQGQELVKEKYKKNLIDVSELNLNDLLYVTDVLITDYSSCFYDFILLNRPVLFYVYDEVEYSAIRGVHRQVSKVAPGTICKTFEELMNALENKVYIDAEVPKFMIDKCSLRQGYTANDKIIDYVIFDKKDIDV